MSHWLDQIQMHLAANYKILWGQLVHCSTVDFLRLMSLLIMGLVLLKVVIHSSYLFTLRSRSPNFSRDRHTRLYAIYDKALTLSGMTKAYDLRQYRTGAFLAFTAGILRPSIYLSPLILDKMDDDEIKALLIHELSHIKRHDNLRIWLVDFIGASIPLITVLSFGLYFVVSVRNSLYALCGTLMAIVVFFVIFKKSLARRRERRCDDLTVGITQDPLSLASSLVKAWEIMSIRKRKLRDAFSPGHHILKNNSCLEKRVRRLTRQPQGWIVRISDQVVRYLSWALVLLFGLFLIRFHGLGDYDRVGIELIEDNQGCHHVRPDPMQSSCTDFILAEDVVEQ